MTTLTTLFEQPTLLCDIIAKMKNEADTVQFVPECEDSDTDLLFLEH